MSDIPSQAGAEAEDGAPRAAREAAASRCDVAEFDDRPIADADLDRILEAGRRIPRSQNRQPWDFIVVTDRRQLRDLAVVWGDGGHVARSAATVALIAPAADERRDAQFDLGQATMSMMLAAAGLGIASGHSAVADQELARRVLCFPEDRTCALLITLGYPAERRRAPAREPDSRPLDEAVHRGRW